MPNPDVMMIIGGVLALLFVFAFWRFKEHRKNLVILGVLGAGAAAFATWWIMFRVDDPTFNKDKVESQQQQNALDEAFGDEGDDDF